MGFSVLALVPGLALAADLGSKAFDTLVEQTMQAWQVPGLAVAAVRGDKVVYQKAFGETDPETGNAVTTKTLFAVGSITKSFTTTLLAMMADDGQVRWDRPVVGYVPEFKLMDEAASRTVTLRDLVTHRTGMPRHDVLWYAGAFGRLEMLRRFRHLRPTTEPREIFQYNNLMFMAAGHAAGRIGGATWEKLIHERLLQPLGMRHSKTGFVGFLGARDRAGPYYGAPDGRVPISARNTDQVGPAASIYSNVEDLSRYLRFHLSGGQLDGRQLLSLDGSADLRHPHIDVPRRQRFKEIGNIWYGMGFYVTQYRGRKLVFHPGFIDGYGGLFAMFPGEGVGVVVLSNLSGHNPVPKIVARLLYDRLLDLKPLPWLDRFRDIEEARRKGRKRPVRPDVDEDDVAVGVSDAPETVPPPLPRPRPLSAWEVAGIYDHPGYGPLQIWVDGDVLSGRFHARVFPLVRSGGDTWRVADTVWPLRRGLRLRFIADDEGRITQLATPIADGPTYPYKVGEVIFERSK